MTACVQYVRILEGLLNCVPSHKAITDSGFPFDPTIPRTEVESDGFVLHTVNYRDDEHCGLDVGRDSRDSPVREVVAGTPSIMGG